MLFFQLQGLKALEAFLGFGIGILQWFIFTWYFIPVYILKEWEKFCLKHSILWLCIGLNIHILMISLNVSFIGREVVIGHFLLGSGYCMKIFALYSFNMKPLHQSLLSLVKSPGFKLVWWCLQFWLYDRS